MKSQRHLLALLALAALVGCQAKPKPGGSLSHQSPFVPPGSTLNAVVPNNDASANKMHDIEGAILNYYFLHKKLPEQFSDIKSAADLDAAVDDVCPGSKLPYIYTPDGIKLQDREARIVLYEPEPLHNGYRLAVIFSEPRDKQPMMTDLIALPESFFLLRPPGATANERLPQPAPPPPPADAGRPAAAPGIHR